MNASVYRRRAVAAESDLVRTQRALVDIWLSGRKFGMEWVEREVLRTLPEFKAYVESLAGGGGAGETLEGGDA